MTNTMEEAMEYIDTKGTFTMVKDDDDRRLTPTQRDIRDRNANLPRHLRRSIDQYRVARGMVPLWGSALERKTRRA
jgi:hypothetical protein